MVERDTDAGPDVLIASDAGTVARIAADLVIAWSAQAIAARGACHIALTGGSSARGLYAALRDPQRVASIDWARVHLWWGDERVVPAEHPESNAGLALRELLGAGGSPIPLANVHPVPVDAATAAGEDAAWAADAYAQEVASVVGAGGDGLPVFDVILLGVGGDGHVLSVFPGSASLQDPMRLAMAIPAPTHITPHLPRVTLSPALLAVARHVLAMVSGSPKAAVVAEVLSGPRDPRRLPAQLALGPNATWLLDRQSASGVAR